MNRKCRFCKAEFFAPLRGRAKVFCSGACRTASHRYRVAFASVPQETETPAPLRSLTEAALIVHAEVELMEHAGEVLKKVRELDAVEAEQIAQAVATSSSVWRYVDEGEDDLRDAAQAFELWADWR